LTGNKDNIEIRRAVADDAAAIAAVLLESFAEYRKLYTVAGFAATTPTREQVVDRINEGPVWLAFLDEAIIGTVSAVVKGRALYIRGLAVLPLARGHRVGRRLLREIEVFASENKPGRLFLSTTPFLLGAIRLYDLCGFARTDEGPGELFGTALFTMEKVVAQTSVCVGVSDTQPNTD
jgi:ribosomal protein S18 acetylase RimI-like enzyme